VCVPFTSIALPSGSETRNPELSRLALLAPAGLTAWRLWPPPRHPSADAQADRLDGLPHVAGIDGDARVVR
jgi:hypothetical protein